MARNRESDPDLPTVAGRRDGRIAGLIAALGLAVTYVLSIVAGYAATLASIPLPWMLGPFFAMAILSVLGMRFRIMPMGRELGQVAIGLAIGARFTLAMLVATASLIPAMLLSTAYVVAFTLVAAFLLKMIARVDDVTAFFATAAGGVADMAHVSTQYGGDPASVAIVHAMRVSCVVAVVPFIVFFLGERGTALPGAAAGSAGLPVVLLSLGFAFLVALVLKPTPLPNPWLVGPILAGMIIGLSGLVEIMVPPILIVIAQIMLGTWLGCQFRRELLTRLPRVTISAFVVATFMIICAAVGATALSGATGLPYSTSFLSLAPAAVTEMVLTAKLMDLDAEIVTAFHIMRIAVVSSTILLVFRFYNHLRKVPDESGI